MSVLQRYGPTELFTRQGRQLARVREATALEVAHTTALADIETAKLEGLQQIAGRAMHGVALVSQLEQQLAQVVPLATSRLQAIGDIHALATAEVVSNAPRRLG